MSRDLRLFVLQKHSLQPHVLVGNLSSTVPVSPTETVESLTEIVRGLLKSHSEFGSWGEDVEDIEFVVHRVSLQHTPSNPLPPQPVFRVVTPETPGESSFGGDGKRWPAG